VSACVNIVQIPFFPESNIFGFVQIPFSPFKSGHPDLAGFEGAPCLNPVS
jgi:hypothetical protein